MLIVSFAAPDAFGRDGLRFGVAHFVVRALHLVLYAVAGRGDRDRFRAVLRIVPTATLAPALLVIAGFLEGQGNWRSGAPRWRSTTSVPWWAGCAAGASRRSTSSSASG
jgi:low temperature requirement protein LtrA